MRPDLVVSPRRAVFAGRPLAFTVGAGGIGYKQAEGDGMTPIGRFALREVWYRADRVAVSTHLPVHPIRAEDGWSDDPSDPDYNQHVHLPHRFSHERLHRDGGEYDVLAVMDYNLNPVMAGRGSAVFLHIWRGQSHPTAGCIAMARDDLLWVLAHWQVDSRVIVQP